MQQCAAAALTSRARVGHGHRSPATAAAARRPVVPVVSFCTPSAARRRRRAVFCSSLGCDLLIQQHGRDTPFRAGQCSLQASCGNCFVERLVAHFTEPEPLPGKRPEVRWTQLVMGVCAPRELQVIRCLTIPL